jgi:DNA-damage-inducible protein J
MATKSANVYVRIEPDVKEQAESILNDLGIPVSNAIQMYYKQIILHQGLPFDVKLPRNRPLILEEMTKEELETEIQKGLDEIHEGKTESLDDAFADIRRQCNI